MNEDKNKNKYRIDTVYTAGQIIETVATNKGAMGIADIAKALGIPINKSLRMCATLEELGFFTKENDRYDLGMKMALYWARKKSRLEGERDRVSRDLESLEQDS